MKCQNSTAKFGVRCAPKNLTKKEHIFYIYMNFTTLCEQTEADTYTFFLQES